jgi:hypothetical protein
MLWWRKKNNNPVQCILCTLNCILCEKMKYCCDVQFWRNPSKAVSMVYLGNMLKTHNKFSLYVVSKDNIFRFIQNLKIINHKSIKDRVTFKIFIFNIYDRSPRVYDFYSVGMSTFWIEGWGWKCHHSFILDNKLHQDGF